MPVYNAESYLREAIKSVLNQTYKNFELIIINDGSTDKSLSIIRSFKDPRIILVSRENRGIVDSLNEGLELAHGKYIARMDGDDICMSNRFRRQVDYLESHKNVGLVVSTVDLIGENGELLDLVWPEDRASLTEEQIAQNMPKNNCIAHPAIMVKAKLLKKYRYHNHKNGEDYDLWLRMLSNGVKIHKINEPLLKYRLHSQSLTQSSAEGGGFLKLISIKQGFLKNQIKNARWGKIEKSVLKSLKSDYLNYYSDHSGKKYIQYPAKALRKSARSFVKSKKIKPYLAERKIIKAMIPDSLVENDKKSVLFILPWVTVGGADKVALDILKGLKDEYNWHLITTQPENDNSWSSLFFKETKNVYHISDFIEFQNNKIRYVCEYAKKNEIDTIVISNSITGYKALPKIRKINKNIKVIDILHGEGGSNDNGGAPKFMQPFDSLIDRHIVISNYLKKYLTKKYNNKPEKIAVIHNGVDVNLFKPKYIIKPINFSWIGRFSYEKNPMLFAKLANTHRGYTFVMAGDGPLFKMVDAYKKENKIDNLTLMGQITSPKKLLEETQFIVMTSKMEGLPIVMLEAGSMGKPVFAPRVGGIPEYVQDNKNGLMHSNDEQLYKNLKQTLEGKISFWNADRIRKNVVENYSIEKMLNEYKKII